MRSGARHTDHTVSTCEISTLRCVTVSHLRFLDLSVRWLVVVHLILNSARFCYPPLVCRDRDLTLNGSRHLTFNITVKLTIKEEMLNLTRRQIFIHSIKQGLTGKEPYLSVESARCGEEAAQVERAALCLRPSACA